MIRLRELLTQIVEDRKKNLRGILALKTGLERKPGYGNYGPPAQPYVTHRSIKGNLKPVIPHRLGQDAKLTGMPNPLLRLPGQPKLPYE